MGTETYPGRQGDAYRLSTAAGGTAITSTEKGLQIAPGMQYLELITRNYASSAVVMAVGMSPWLTVIRTTNSLIDGNTVYDEEAQYVGSSVITLSDQSTAGNGDFFYVGAERPFKGVIVDVTATNSASTIITVKYWNGSAWADISDTDGTISGGVSLAQDGIINWSVPAAWAKTTLKASGDTSLTSSAEALRNLYWTRWEWSVALDSSVTLTSLIAQPEFAEPEYPSGLVKELDFATGFGHHGGLTVKMNTGTGNLIMNAFNKSANRELPV
jgi:hypothetical protein